MTAEESWVPAGVDTSKAMVAVLHFIPDEADPWQIVATFREALAPGSYLVLVHGTSESRPDINDAFETAYLAALMSRNDGNITRSAQEAGLTRYHLRELLKRHGLKGGDLE